MRTIISLVLGTALWLVMSSCAPNGFQALSNQTQELTSIESLKTCSFTDTKTLSNILKQKLGIAQGDVPVVDVTGKIKKAAICKVGNSTDCYYLNKYKADLGESDPSQDRLTNTDCTPSKFRITTEMFINACEMAMSDDTIKSKLFPQGVDNFDYLYLTFIGRLPEGAEIQVLTSLISNFSDEKKQAVAGCASVAASLESLTIM